MNKLNKVLMSFLKESTGSLDLSDSILSEGYDIETVERDSNGRFKSVDGVMYKLSGNNDKVVDVNTVFTTTENIFYEDQIDRYVDYIEDGGVLETLPVNEIKYSDIGPEEHLQRMEDEDVEFAYEVADKFFGGDMDEYNEMVEHFWDEAEIPNEIEQYIARYYEQNIPVEYHLIDHNHRFTALKRIGVSEIMVEVMN